MNRSSATLASQSVAVALWTTRHADVKDIESRASHREAATAGHYSPFHDLLRLYRHTASAITLESVLQTTLEKNPAIQEAKAGLEQATGQRLVFGPWSGLAPRWACRLAFRPVTGLVKAE